MLLLFLAFGYVQYAQRVEERLDRRPCGVGVCGEAVDGAAAALYLYVYAPHVVRTAGDGLHEELHEHDLLVDQGLDRRHGGIHRAVARGDGHALVVAELQHHGRRRDERAGGHLQEFERYGLLFHAVDVAYQV